VHASAPAEKKRRSSRQNAFSCQPRKKKRGEKNQYFRSLDLIRAKKKKGEPTIFRTLSPIRGERGELARRASAEKGEKKKGMPSGSTF